MPSMANTMTSDVMVATVSGGNRISLPKEAREALKVKMGDLVAMKIVGDELRVFKADIRKRGD